MENRSIYLCDHRIYCECNFRIFCERTSAGRKRNRKRTGKRRKDFFPGIYEAFAFQQIFPDDRSVLYSDLCADRYRRNRYLLYDICLGKSGIAWYVLNGTDAPDGDRSCIYTGIGEKVQRNV